MSEYNWEEKTGYVVGVKKMAKPLEHRSVKDEASKVKVTPKTVTRRQFFRLGIAGAALLTLQGGIIGSIVSTPKAAQAQPNVKSLKPFSLKKLKELDEKMDDKYQRIFRENKRDGGTYTFARVNGESGNYVSASAATYDRMVSILYRSKPGGELAGVGVNLQTLYEYYEVACADARRTPKEHPWVKIMFDVDERGVTIWATFVDEKPRYGDSSDLKKDYPILGQRYWKEKNAVSVSDVYLRIEDAEKIARKSTP